MHVEDMVHGRRARVKNKDNYRKVEGRWKALCRRGRLLDRNGRESMMAPAICVDYERLNPALTSVFSPHPRFSCVLTRLWERVPHVTVLEKLRTNQLFARGLRDVSLSSCLEFDISPYLAEPCHKLTVVALCNPVLYSSAFS